MTLQFDFVKSYNWALSLD